MKIKCNKCGYIGDESEFPKGRDFFQHTFISGCPKKCGNSQSPDSASLRMMQSDEKRPFEYVRSEPKNETTLGKVLHKADEAS